MPQIDIGVEIPPLPEGWSGTPDELLEFFKENASFVFDGEFPTGQIGGSMPTQDVGIWYDTNGVEKYTNGAYHPITDVPIGACLPWASIAGTPPPNYLFCDGTSYARTAQNDLFTVIGTTWGIGNSTDLTTFNVPDMAGRTPVGVGVGDYKYQGFIGRMKDNGAVGSYLGFEWPLPILGFPPAAPLKITRNVTTMPVSAKGYTSIRNPAAVMAWIIRAR